MERGKSAFWKVEYWIKELHCNKGKKENDYILRVSGTLTFNF
jgi:hypothetical protein